ncbi:MAG: mechanosensitive ion channel domain-containing protein [Candidatus Omnitrophota bacterium]
MNVQELLSKVYIYMAEYGLNIIAAILIFIIGKWLAKLVVSIVKKILTKAKIEKTLTNFVSNIVNVGLMAFVIIAALNKLGVETTSFIAVLGAAGLAVGLALQGSLANFAAGVLLIIFKPFKVGDFIQAGGALGTVQEIQIFNTIIHTMDNRREFVPNAKITGDNITNFSDVDKRRVDLVFSISYSDNIKTAKEALKKVLAADERVLKDPKPVIAVSELADSSVNLVCRPWVKPEHYWDVYFDTIENGKIALEQNGITIPFPQTDVHLFKEKI